MTPERKLQPIHSLKSPRAIQNFKRVDEIEKQLEADALRKLEGLNQHQRNAILMVVKNSAEMRKKLNMKPGCLERYQVAPIFKVIQHPKIKFATTSVVAQNCQPKISKDFPQDSNCRSNRGEKQEEYDVIHSTYYKETSISTLNLANIVQRSISWTNLDSLVEINSNLAKQQMGPIADEVELFGDNVSNIKITKKPPLFKTKRRDTSSLQGLGNIVEVAETTQNQDDGVKIGGESLLVTSKKNNVSKKSVFEITAAQISRRGSLMDKDNISIENMQSNDISRSHTSKNGRSVQTNTAGFAIIGSTIKNGNESILENSKTSRRFSSYSSGISFSPIKLSILESPLGSLSENGPPSNMELSSTSEAYATNLSSPATSLIQKRRSSMYLNSNAVNSKSSRVEKAASRKNSSIGIVPIALNIENLSLTTKKSILAGNRPSFSSGLSYFEKSSPVYASPPKVVSSRRSSEVPVIFADLLELDPQKYRGYSSSSLTVDELRKNLFESIRMFHMGTLVNTEMKFQAKLDDGLGILFASEQLNFKKHIATNVARVAKVSSSPTEPLEGQDDNLQVKTPFIFALESYRLTGGFSQDVGPKIIHSGTVQIRKPISLADKYSQMIGTAKEADSMVDNVDREAQLQMNESKTFIIFS